MCALLFFIALGVRLLYWQDSRVEFLRARAMPTTLVNLYLKDSARMVEQESILIPRELPDPGDARMLIHPPGYAVLLLLLYGKELSAYPYTSLRLTQVLSDCLSVIMLFLIACELFPSSVAIIAGLLAALSPHLAYYSLWLSPDSLAVLPILFAVYLIVVARKKPSLAAMLAAGGLIGLSCWLRSNALLLAPFLGALVIILFNGRKRFVYAAAVCIAAAVAISPITIRNWVVYHRLIPLTIVAGLNLNQGIAEYDKEGRFGMLFDDSETAKSEAELCNRPEFGRSLWLPDGVDRDQARLDRGLEVIRGNPAWFAGVMLRRCAFMLRYNDHGPQNNVSNTTVAPAVGARPAFGHNIHLPSDARPLWSRTRPELAAGTDEPANRARMVEDHQETDSTAGPFRSSPFAVRQNTDYILRVSAEVRGGPTNATVATADSRTVLASATLERARKQKRRRKRDEAREIERQALSAFTDIPFATGNQTEVLVISDEEAPEASTPPTRIERVELFERGQTPLLWTHAPRSIIRGIQRNVFKTGYLRMLIVVGLILLAHSSRWKTLAILIAVPAYYLISHAPFCTEYRYIIAIHYFMFMLTAVSIHWSTAALGQAVRLGYGSLRRRWLRTATDQA